MTNGIERPTPLLTATGQVTPLRHCGALSAVALGAVAGAPVLLNYGHDIGGIGLFVVGALALLGSVSYALRRIACPRCKTPWLQYALGEKSVNGWLVWLTKFAECPECGLSAGRDSEGKASRKDNV